MYVRYMYTKAGKRQMGEDRVKIGAPTSRLLKYELETNCGLIGVTDIVVLGWCKQRRGVI